MEYVDKQCFLEDIINPENSFSITSGGRVVCEKGYWEVPRRHIPDHLIYLCESGSFNLWTESGTVILKPNQLFLCQPEIETHFTLSANVAKATVVYIRFNIMKHRELIALKTPYLVSPALDFHRDCLSKIIFSQVKSSSDTPFSNKIYLAPLLLDMLSSPGCLKKQGGLKPLVVNMVSRYIHDNIRRRITSTDLAELTGYNQAHFSRQFKISYGMSPSEYITRERIHTAAILLEEPGMNVSEIADYLGYRDVFFFSKQFKKFKGVSPKKWQQRLYYS